MGFGTVGFRTIGAVAIVPAGTGFPAPARATGPDAHLLKTMFIYNGNHCQTEPPGPARRNGCETPAAGTGNLRYSVAFPGSFPWP